MNNTQKAAVVGLFLAGCAIGIMLAPLWLKTDVKLQREYIDLLTENGRLMKENGAMLMAVSNLSYVVKARRIGQPDAPLGSQTKSN